MEATVVEGEMMAGAMATEISMPHTTKHGENVVGEDRVEGVAVQEAGRVVEEPRVNPLHTA